MLLSLERLGTPSGINDVKRIKIQNNEHFIASFGNKIKIYNENNEIHNFSVHFNVIYILPYQDCYFLIGKREYAVYKGSNEIKNNFFDREFTGIADIYSIGNSIILLDDNGRYTVGQIRNFVINLDVSLTDNQFYNIISAVHLDDRVVMLAKTFSKKYLITYTLENNILKSSKKELSVGIAILKLPNNTIALLNQEGIWKYQDKPVFVKEFANYKITCSVLDAIHDRSIIFCENGEVISITRDFNHHILGVLKSAVNRASIIGNIIVCGSSNSFYILDIADMFNVLFKCDKYVNESEERVIFSKLKERINSFSKQDNKDDSETVKKLKANNIRSIDLESSIGRYDDSIRKIFKTQQFKAVMFESYSVLNNKIIEPILSISNELISTEKGILKFTKERVFEYKLQTIFSKIFDRRCVLFSNMKIYIMNINTTDFIFHKVDFDLCDFYLMDNELYCIDVNEKLHILNLSTFIEEKISFNIVDRSVFFDNKLDADIDTSIFDEFPENEPDTCKKATLCANGCMFTVIEKVLHKIFDAGSYIYNITLFNQYFLVSSKNTCIFDPESKEIFYLNLHSVFSFILNGLIYLITPSSQVIVFDPNLTYPKFNFKNIIQHYWKVPIKLENSLDLKSTKYSFKKKFIEFKNFIQTCFCPIRKGLFCAGLANVESKESILVFIEISKKSISIRKSIKLQSIPLSISSFNEKVCVITSTQILILKLIFGKIKLSTKIDHITSFVKGSYFYNRNTVVVSSKDWFYLIVDLKKKTVEKYTTNGAPVPFILNEKSGYAIKNKLFWNDAEIDCIEDLSHIVSSGDIALALTNNGSVIQIEVSEKDSSRFIYNSTPSVKNNLIN